MKRGFGLISMTVLSKVFAISVRPSTLHSNRGLSLAIMRTSSRMA